MPEFIYQMHDARKEPVSYTHLFLSGFEGEKKGIYTGTSRKYFIN